MDLPSCVPLTIVAERIGVTAPTLVRWSRRGEFPRLYRYGGRWNVEEAAVARWLESTAGDPDVDAMRDDYRDAAGRGVWAP